MTEAFELPQQSEQPSWLEAQLVPQCQRHPGLSGIYPLSDGLDAFAARYLLMQKAERSLDIQYYIWQNDLSGRLLFSAMLEGRGAGLKFVCCWMTIIRRASMKRWLSSTVTPILRCGCLIPSHFAPCGRWAT